MQKELVCVVLLKTRHGVKATMFKVKAKDLTSKVEGLGLQGQGHDFQGQAQRLDLQGQGQGSIEAVLSSYIIFSLYW